MTIRKIMIYTNHSRTFSLYRMVFTKYIKSIMPFFKFSVFITYLYALSVLAWRIPGVAEPGGLPSMGSHRVGHD